MALAKQVLTWFCMCEDNHSTSQSKKKLYAILTLVMFIGDIDSIAASAMYFLKYVSTDFGGSLYAAFQVCDAFAAAYAVLIGVIMRHKMEQLFEGLSDIYRDGNYSTFNLQ